MASGACAGQHAEGERCDYGVALYSVTWGTGVRGHACASRRPAKQVLLPLIPMQESGTWSSLLDAWGRLWTELRRLMEHQEHQGYMTPVGTSYSCSTLPISQAGSNGVGSSLRTSPIHRSRHHPRDHSWRGASSGSAAGSDLISILVNPRDESVWHPIGRAPSRVEFAQAMHVRH